MTVCVDDWPPHIIKDADGEPGPMAQAVKTIFAHAGYEAALVWAPWQRCMENVRLGIWDASPGWSKTPAREQDFLFSVPLTSSYHQFMSLKSKAFYWSEWEDLKGLTIGITNSYSYGDTFEKYRSEGLFKTEEGLSDEANLKKLLKGHLDLFVLNKNTAWSIANKHLSKSEVDRLSLHPKPVSQNRESHVIFSKRERSKRLVQDFDGSVRALEKSGEFQKLFEYLRH